MADRLTCSAWPCVWLTVGYLVRSLWPASPQEMKDGSQEGELFSAGLNVGLLPKAAVPTLICMCLKTLVCI